MSTSYPTIIPEAYTTHENLQDAYRRGWNHGHGTGIPRRWAERAEAREILLTLLWRVKLFQRNIQRSKRKRSR